MTSFKTVDDYIESFSSEKQIPLNQIRKLITELVPEAEEVMSYGMPAFKYQGILVWYAVHTNHVGFYPRASAIVAFKKELSPYKTSKGAVQFPLNKPLPLKLIREITLFRAEENLFKLKKVRKK